MTPKHIIDHGAMHVRQWIAVIITVALNALDGFDILSSAFAGPGIKQEWNLAPDGLGAVLAMELVGMGVGSLLLGGLADKIGRRPTILICLSMMAAGMFLAAFAASPQTLSMWRFMTGLGIGGMLASINAVANELSSAKGRSLAMALMVIGYPVGGFIGGLVVKYLLPANDWRAIFEFGGAATLVCIPLVWALVPETPSYLNFRRPAGALERINRTLASFRLTMLEHLPPVEAGQAKASIADIFKPAMLRTTLLLSFAYAFHAITFYFVLKMAPTIMSDPSYAGQSFTRAEGAGVLAYSNLGGAAGGLVFGWFMHRFGIKRATMAALAMSVLLVAYFGMGQSTLGGWTLAVMGVGLFTNSAIVGYYSAWAIAYPTHVRATGTGFALSIGRAGAAFSPFLAGLLFARHMDLQTVALVMCSGSLLSLILFAMVDLKDAEAA
ncbi:MFS transporter [Novosphingobium sp.]|uniref:MFS transporter n=1 Tax=Novosphingobium sp. TaxID=1874826 RepID=UPI0025D7AD87|nr:MFS transporter [Novosphingobium sp.]